MTMSKGAALSGSLIAGVLLMLSACAQRGQVSVCPAGERMRLVWIGDSIFREYYLIHMQAENGSHIRILSQKQQLQSLDCAVKSGRDLVIGESYCIRLYSVDSVIHAKYTVPQMVRGLADNGYMWRDTDTGEYQMLWSDDTIARDMVRFSPNICGLKYVEPGR